jgi:hypothetical protein
MYVRFTGALTLTYNASSMILPGTRDIVTEAGDRAIFVSLGSGNWFCMEFLKANGRALGDVIVITDSGTANTLANEMRGQVHKITGAYTRSMATAAVGMNATFESTTAAVYSIDVTTGTDVIILNGVALAAGNKVTSGGLAYERLYCECLVANVYECMTIRGVHSDGGP